MPTEPLLQFFKLKRFSLKKAGGVLSVSIYRQGAVNVIMVNWCYITSSFYEYLVMSITEKITFTQLIEQKNSV